MRRLFPWLLWRFLLAFGVLVAVQTVTFIVGINLILSGYERTQIAQYEKAAEIILIEPEKFDPVANVLPGPFFVFSAEGELLYSNRGRGKSLSTGDYRQIYNGEEEIGYYHAGEIHFADNQANRVFLSSIILLSFFSIILSVLIGFLTAWLSSGRIAAPIRSLRKDIHGIRSLKSIAARSFEISELSEMSKDVSEVSMGLSRQEEYKQKWLRDISHDLRTPLAGLRAQLEAMADGILEPNAERFKRQLQEIYRLEELVSSIGELTAIEDRNEVSYSVIAAEQFIERLCSPFEIELERKKIRLIRVVETEHLYGEEKLLLRAIGNILANAVKYVDENGTIRLEVNSRGIEIENDGPDIPEEQLDLIFTRLYRGDSSRTEPGSGLGLAITREIIRLHEGEVRAVSREPRGVRFLIRLPKAGNSPNK